MNTQIWLIERIKLSFKVLSNNFLDLTLPIFGYQLISYVLIWTIFASIMVSSLKENKNTWMDFFNFIDSPMFIVFLIMWIIFYVLYLILFIPVIIWLIKSIKQITQWEKVTPKENLQYWFDNIFSSFKTYWFIFQYVALIPSLLIIIWWIMLLSWLMWNSSIMYSLGWFISFIWIIILIIFSLTRGIRSSLALNSAIDYNEFTKDNFSKSIESTNWKWWKIVKNFILLWITVFLITSILQIFMWIFSSETISFDTIMIPWWIDKYVNSFSVISQIINWILNQIITTITLVFSSIFWYLLYLNIKNENNIIPNSQVETASNINDDKIEI